MRTISWKQPLIALFIGGSIVVACSDDEPAATPEEAGSLCGNGKVDKGEDCDTESKDKLPTCAEATMMSKPTGTVKCSSKCAFDTSGCKANAGGTGGGGVGGGTGGSVATGGAPMGGKGGTTST